MTRARVLTCALTVVRRHYIDLFEQLAETLGPAVAAEMMVAAILNLKLVLPDDAALQAEPEYRSRGEYP